MYVVTAGQTRWTRSADTAIAFLEDYCTSSLSSGARGYKAIQAIHGPDWKDHSVLRMQFHLRSFCTGKLLEYPTVDGILCYRLVANIQSPSGSRPLRIRERRRAISICCPFPRPTVPEDATAGYVLVRVADEKARSETVVDHRRDPPQLVLCKPWTGVAEFQRLLSEELGKWAEEWHAILQGVDDIVDFKAGTPKLTQLVITTNCVFEGNRYYKRRIAQEFDVRRPQTPTV
jgi:hypothetical protein